MIEHPLGICTSVVLLGLYEAQLIKTHGKKLGFNLKIQIAKQPATGSYLDFSLKWQSCFQESQNQTVSESSLFPFYNPFQFCD